MNTPRIYTRGCKLESPHRRLVDYPDAKRMGGFIARHSLSPGLVTLASLEGPIFDQGQTSSCEGHRASMALQVAFNYLNTPLPFTPSPDAIYKDARMYERRPTKTGLPPLEDSGCYTIDVVRVLGALGVKALANPPPDGRYSDVDPASVSDEPLLTDLAEEREHLVKDAYAIDVSDTVSAISLIQAALMCGYPVGLDITADTIFERWGHAWTDSTPPLTTCNPNDPTAGGHAILVTEIQANTDQSVVLGGPNSWGDWGAPALGTQWGPKIGHWRGTADWFRAAVSGATIFKCSKADG